MTATAARPRHFFIGRGPFIDVVRRIHLARRDGYPRAIALVTIAWAPLFVAALLRILVGHRPAPILFDISVHARLLVAIPLMVLGERLLTGRIRSAVDQLYEGQFIGRAALDPIVDRAEKLRDSRFVELLLFTVVVLLGIGTVTGVIGATGVFSGIADGGKLSIARVWYGVVALPITQFLLARWLWHWVIWSYILIRVARLKLVLVATHPDHAGGIGFLSAPIASFAFLVAAQSSTFAGVWATEILHGRATLQGVVPGLIVFLMLSVVMATAPLFAFVPMLYNVRRHGLRAYNGFGLRYTREFQRKWFRSAGVSPLGTPDLQSLNDLIGSYGSTEKTRTVPFSTRSLIILWGAAVLPMTPLAFASMPVTEVFAKLARILLGVAGAR